MRVVFKNMVVHPQQVQKAHQGTCAAAKQQKFIEYYSAFWDKAFKPYSESRDPSKLGEENILAIAKEIGLDPARFKTDMDSQECVAFVQADMQELGKFQVSGTPAFFVNGKFIGGALPKEGFKQVIDQQLKVAEASGVSGADYYNKVVMAKGEKAFKSASE